MADAQNRVRKQAQRAEHDIQDLTGRIQSQVNELVDRVTGVREARRQALTTGLAIGALLGVFIGVAIGIALNELNEQSEQRRANQG